MDEQIVKNQSVLKAQSVLLRHIKQNGYTKTEPFDVQEYDQYFQVTTRFAKPGSEKKGKLGVKVWKESGVEEEQK